MMQTKIKVSEFLNTYGLEKDIAYDMVCNAIQYGFGSGLKLAGDYMRNEDIPVSEANDLCNKGLNDIIHEFMNREVSNS